MSEQSSPPIKRLLDVVETDPQTRFGLSSAQQLVEQIGELRTELEALGGYCAKPGCRNNGTIPVSVDGIGETSICRPCMCKFLDESTSLFGD
ncbi:hypothetical protein GCM10009000_013110 [Halobacterium noricense]|uniref:Uncharacterized protein n=1 Tax=Haladaptatus pallidirubidus TaxID=1008152 RepID=A0AAV3UC76_9EURY